MFVLDTTSCTGNERNIVIQKGNVHIVISLSCSSESVCNVQEIVITFGDANPPPTEHPEILSTVPANDSIGVQVDTVIYVSFSNPMDEGSLSLNNVSVKDEDGHNVPVELSYSEGGGKYILTIKPVHKLNYKTKYNVALSSAIIDNAGENLENGYGFGFETHEREVKAKAITTAAGTCMIDMDGAMHCFGGLDGYDPAYFTVSNMNNEWVSLDAGRSANLQAPEIANLCAIDVDGSLYCAGYSGAGSLTPANIYEWPTMFGNAGEWSMVSVSFDHYCAIKKDGSLWCWGGNASGQLGIGSFENKQDPVLVGNGWTSVSVGEDNYGGGYTCAIKVNGTLYCWGSNKYGQLGDGTTTNRSSPFQVGTSSNWTMVSTGMTHACAINSTGTLYCWGSNRFGDLGRVGGDSGVPVEVSGGKRWLSVSTGKRSFSFTCAIDVNNNLYCWGYNVYGQFGDATSDIVVNTPVHVADDMQWKSVSVGLSHTCAINMSDEPYCWGSNSTGQTGNGLTSFNGQPKQVNSDTDWQSVYAGISSTCGIKQDGSLFCWGAKYVMVGGSLALSGDDKPVKYGTFSDWKTVSTGDGGTCGIKIDGKLYCWGDNDFGECGTGNKNFVAGPTLVNGDVDWATVSTASSHTCATKQNGTLYCWGYNGDGQLGDGTIIDKYVPTKVSENDWQTVFYFNFSRTCALKNNGKLYCWGGGTTIPTIASDKTWSNVALFTSVDSEGRLYRWGLNGNSLQSTQVGLDSDWRLSSRDCAIKTDSSLYCWGQNVGDQPELMSDDANWVTMSSWSGTTCAINSSNNLFCWGSNSFGETGTGDAWLEVPARVQLP